MTPPEEPVWVTEYLATLRRVIPGTYDEQLDTVWSNNTFHPVKGTIWVNSQIAANAIRRKTAGIHHGNGYRIKLEDTERLGVTLPDIPAVVAATAKAIHQSEINPRNALEAAQHWAYIGVPVFPVRKDKTPLTPHGYKDASADPVTIEKWFKNKYNVQVGIPTTSTIVVIDLDGTSAEQEWLDRNHGDYGTQFILKTPHGKHLYFSDTGLRRSIRVLTTGESEGIDVLAEGGYTIVYGPRRGWTDIPNAIDQLPAVPSWIKELTIARERPYTPLPANYARPALASHAMSRWGEAVERNALERITNAPAGARHDVLLRSAVVLGGAMASGHITLTHEDVIAHLAHASIASGHDSSDAWRTARDGIERGLARPLTPSEQEKKQETSSYKETMNMRTPGKWTRDRAWSKQILSDLAEDGEEKKAPPPEVATNNNPPIRWRKLDNGWAVEAPAGVLHAGETVTVPRQDGREEEVTIHAVSTTWTDKKTGEHRQFGYPTKTSSESAANLKEKLLDKAEAKGMDRDHLDSHVQIVTVGSSEPAVKKSPPESVATDVPRPNPSRDPNVPHWVRAKAGYFAIEGPAADLQVGKDIMVNRRGAPETISIGSIGTPWIDPETGVEMVRARPAANRRERPDHQNTIHHARNTTSRER